jgi:hypothetical protein
MAGSTIDHMVSVIVFIAAIMIFLGLFSQTNQTAITYERHKVLATKTSDLLDNMLLNPGIPADWGKTSAVLVGFGVQDPEFTQYQVSAFSLMRLASCTNVLDFDKSTSGIYYNDASLGYGAALLTPKASELPYYTAAKLLGINSTYGFQLSLTPIITVTVTETQADSPLTLTLNAHGTGFPFANATINYCLVQVNMGQLGDYPSYTIENGVAATDRTGTAHVAFASVTDPTQAYAFIASVHLYGVVGVGYHSRISTGFEGVVPLVEDTASQRVALVHSFDLNSSGPAGSSLHYNTTFLISKEDYTLRELTLGQNSSYGIVTSGEGNPYPTVTLPTCTTGILIATYQNSMDQCGVVMMPWGVGALAFPVTFGGNISGHDWVATDMRQVTIGGVAYQAKLALWTLGVSGQ